MAPTSPTLILSLLPEQFGVCRFDTEAEIPPWALTSPFFSVTRTAEEISVVCVETAIPVGTRCELGWRCLKVHGPLDFELTGILVSLAAPLAQAGISLFAISTYDTDYLLVKETDRGPAELALQAAGHKVL